VLLRVVVFLDPVGERPVERVERGQVEFAREELVAHRSEKALMLRSA